MHWLRDVMPRAGEEDIKRRLGKRQEVFQYRCREYKTSEERNINRTIGSRQEVLNASSIIHKTNIIIVCLTNGSILYVESYEEVTQ